MYVVHDNSCPVKKINKHRVDGLWCAMPFSTIFIYIVAETGIPGENH
jgi:hypothetical protein